MDVRAMSVLRRFEVAERLDLRVEEVVKRLEKRKFVPLDDAMEETERFGWITTEHLFDTRFDVEKVICDPYAVFALRVDKRRIPQNLLRAHVKIEEKAYAEATGKKVGPAKRREIRDGVREKLVAKVLPVAASFQVVWHLGTGMILFGNAGEKVCEAFVRQFEDTFDATLVAQSPRTVGLRLLEGDAEAIDRTAPTSFCREEPGYKLVGAAT